MFGFLSPTRRTKGKTADGPRLRVEQLEARDCPSALAISTFSALPAAGHQVVLTGTVSGDNAAGAVVNFSGGVTGSVTADANGNYSYTTNSALLGTVTAVAVDANKDTSNPVSAALAENGPTITLAVTAVNGSTYTLSGTVTDLDPAGEIVTISGAHIGTATTDANGKFSFTMATSSIGTVDVSTTDLWGKTSNTAAVAPGDFPPVIQNFTATQGNGNTWILRGTVTAPNPQGMVVTFGGMPALAGLTATVNADGTFYLVVTLGSNDYGTVTAQTTNQAGQESNLASYAIG